MTVSRFADMTATALAIKRASTASLLMPSKKLSFSRANESPNVAKTSAAEQTEEHISSGLSVKTRSATKAAAAAASKNAATKEVKKDAKESVKVSGQTSRWGWDQQQKVRS